MRPKNPRVVSPDEVHIRRDGEHAHIEYADPSYGGMSLKVGPKIARMTDEEIVDLHNEVVRGMEETRERRDHVAVEIPVGQPQIEYSATGEQWVPRGHVLRCVINQGTGDPGRATITIDDHELTAVELGRLLASYAGWGMRIVFVPEDELEDEPVIEVRDPDEG